MRIVYGVHGYGRGHAMRTLSVLPELARRHDLLVLAGGDAFRSVSETHVVTEIPTLGFYHHDDGRISNARTIRGNWPLMRDVLFRRKDYRRIESQIREFDPHVIISDSEIYTHWIAHRLKIPRITFDHFSVLVYCELGLPFVERVRQWGSSMSYRALYGTPERVVATAFFDAMPCRESVQVVGPAIRPEVRAKEPTRGDYLLVYLNRGKDEFTPSVKSALKAQQIPIRVYGAPRTGTDRHIEYKPVANHPFIDDLAGCRAVFSTTGNQLLGEVRYFGKAMLGMPQDCLEQRINAYQLERMGIGQYVRRGNLTARTLSSFLDWEQANHHRITRHLRDGATEALEHLDACFTELAEKRLTAGVHTSTPIKEAGDEKTVLS